MPTVAPVGRLEKALLPGDLVFCVFLRGVVGAGEAVQRGENVREYQRVNITCPKEIEMFVVRDLVGNGLRGELLEHDLDIDQRIAPTVHENDGRLDIPSWVPSHLGIPIGRAQGKVLLDVVVVHLERFVADDLEPMNHALGAREGIQVRVGGKLLADGDVLRLPVEEERQAEVDEFGEDGRVEDGLPHGC